MPSAHPLNPSGFPRGAPYIVLNELAERFSFYGMRTILVVFMTTQLLDAEQQLAVMDQAEAKRWYHTFEAAVYFFPVLGAVLSDAFWGKYRTILLLSCVYCLGHLCLAIDTTRSGLMLGLSLIALGSGGIKPCVSAHLGDQFSAAQGEQLSRVFSWFFLAMNVAGLLASLSTPYLLAEYGSHVAFGVPGLLMGLATLTFWLGRKTYIRVPPVGLAAFRVIGEPQQLKRVGELLLIYVFAAFFWAMSAQTGAAWVFQAQKLDRQVLGMELLPAQIQSFSPLLNLVLIPSLTYGLYPLLGRIRPLNALHKIGLGFGAAMAAFLVSSWIEMLLSWGQTPTIWWQVLAHVLMGAGEIMVAMTCLELSYKRAPRVLKSLVMAAFMLSVSLGNVFTGWVNYVIRRPDGSVALEGASYYLFFVGVMLGASLLYAWVASRMQDIHEAPEESSQVTPTT